MWGSCCKQEKTVCNFYLFHVFLIIQIRYLSSFTSLMYLVSSFLLFCCKYVFLCYHWPPLSTYSVNTLVSFFLSVVITWITVFTHVMFSFVTSEMGGHYADFFPDRFCHYKTMWHACKIFIFLLYRVSHDGSSILYLRLREIFTRFRGNMLHPFTDQNWD